MFTGLIRTIILYILIIAGIRLMGKRQVGELEPSELVLSLIIADLAAVPMQDFGIPLLTGVIPILALLAMTMILSVMTMKSIRFRALLCGRPSVVIRRGEIDQGEMRRNRLTVDELLEEADIRLDGPLNINVEDGRLVIASSETEQDDPLNDLESGFLTRLQRSGVSLNGLRYLLGDKGDRDE